MCSIVLYTVLLLFLNCARTSECIDQSGLKETNDVNKRFSLWPSMHNGAKLMSLRRREIQQGGASEGGIVREEKPLASLPHSSQPIQPDNPTQNSQQLQPVPLLEQSQPQPPAQPSTSPELKPTVDTQSKESAKETTSNGKAEAPKVSVNISSTNTKENVIPSTTNSNDTKANVTVSSNTDTIQLSLNKPGVVKRGLIVFGGFALLAVAYFIFYRKKNGKNDSKNIGATDANQFRYGVLHSDDRRDNLELSQVPLTMDSDDDEDEDLEIFDLEQKKKSLSYVNLQTNDEDIVFDTQNRDIDGDNLLLDIEDRASDTLINWSANGNKSIL